MKKTIIVEVIAITIFSAIVKAGILKHLDNLLFNMLYIGSETFVLVFSETASIYLFAALIIVIAVADLWRYRKLSLFSAGLALLLILNSLLVYAIKLFFQIPRPLTGNNVSTDILDLIEKFSYPSGHTARAFALASYYSINTKINGKIMGFLYIWAVSIALTRLLLGVHWFSDVIGGAAIGILTAQLTQIILPYTIKALPLRIARKLLRS
ncbi:phosphatase PAP2 family protein [Ignisphaera sp. 4213-co]|uniref:Phosphatase PAP2 family protein n=1 Tax=Ignisphaera cupida TaxID=3050454 RepID=A0ABD4Z5Y6_9CREN|nr:phosphatase PAP2 family protein [Ignisphaera sp. 4213-co]MDK6028422.1 phosphatase PAP2 family protein [Ignisphaera sp. 4213-co]